MERDWGLGAWIDMGNIMTNVMILAPAFGLATCPQQAWAEYGAAVRQVLPVPDHHIIVSGMALGYADPEAPVNKLTTEREPIEKFLFSTCNGHMGFAEKRGASSTLTSLTPRPDRAISEG